MGGETIHIVSESPEETVSIGRVLGRLAEPGTVIALTGPLGAGKTVLAKGIAEGAGVADPREVTSPTFVLVHEYEGRLPIRHVDAYRLSGAEDLAALGSDEMFFGDGLCIIEWADRAAAALPDERLDVVLEHAGPARRRLAFSARGALHRRLMGRLAAALAEG